MREIDLLVAGGGIVGASIALHAAEQGARVLLVDRNDEGRATDAGAGIVSPGTDLLASAALAALGAAAGRHYESLVERLPGSTSWARRGTLVVALDESDTPVFEELLSAARRGGGERAATGASEIDSHEARRLFPLLAPVERALFDPRGARVDGRQLETALRAAARDCGADFLAGEVEGFEVTKGEAAAAMVDGRRLACGAAAIAGGAWSPSLAQTLGTALPVSPQRGQIVHLQTADRRAGDWPVVVGLREHYLVPWSDGRVSAGATRETGSGFDVDTTAHGLREVLDHALALAPGLGTASLVEVRVGLRPLSEDGLPIVGRLPGLTNVWVATGHGPAGLTLGPYSGKLIAEAALGAEPDPGASIFDPARFSRTV
jgi:D-amino-acid dehydrogenase